MKITTIHFKDAQWKELKMEAIEKGVTMSEVIRRMVDQCMSNLLCCSCKNNQFKEKK